MGLFKCVALWLLKALHRVLFTSGPSVMSWNLSNLFMVGSSLPFGKS